MRVNFFTGKAGDPQDTYFLHPTLKLQKYKHGFEIVLWLIRRNVSIRIMWNK